MTFFSSSAVKPTYSSPSVLLCLPVLTSASPQCSSSGSDRAWPTALTEDKVFLGCIISTPSSISPAEC